MSFRTFQFLPAEPKGDNKPKGDNSRRQSQGDDDSPEEKKMQMQPHNSCFIVGGECRFTLNSTFYELVEIVEFEVKGEIEKITRTEFYSRVENAANAANNSWKGTKPGLNVTHIRAIFDKNKQFLERQGLWADRDVDTRATLKKLWHACIQYRKRWNALKLRDLTRKDRFIDSWENFLIYVYAPYFWKHPEFLKKSNFYYHMGTDDSRWDLPRDALQDMETMMERSWQKIEEIAQGNEVTRYIIRQFDRRLPEWQIDPELKPYMLDFIYMNREILQPCIDDFMAKDAKNPIESREGDLLTQQMKHLVDELDSANNVEYMPADNAHKMQLLGYGIEDSNRCISDDRLNNSTCFVTGKASKGVGDHLYPILNAWKITGKCGSNSLWNLLPVISSINKGYTRIMVDIAGQNIEVDLEVTEITRVYTDERDVSVPIDEFMTGITRENYNQKKGQIKYVDMSQTILSEEEEWDEGGQICILKPPQRKIISHVRVRILSTVELQGKITKERISNYVLSEPLDIWMKIYLWRKYAEKRGANLSYEISQEVHKKLLGVLRNSFMTIAEETQKIIDFRVLAGQRAKGGK